MFQQRAAVVHAIPVQGQFLNQLLTGNCQSGAQTDAAAFLNAAERRLDSGGKFACFAQERSISTERHTCVIHYVLADH